MLTLLGERAGHVQKSEGQVGGILAGRRVQQIVMKRQLLGINWGHNAE